MKTLGLIGGLSWPSTISYYRLINEGVNKKLGRHHAGKLIVYSLDFEEIETLQYMGDWQSLNIIMLTTARRLEKAGADAIIICSNTMHACYQHIQSHIHTPVLHIANAVGKKMVEKNIEKAGLLGTGFLMESDLYTGILSEKYHIEIIKPDPGDMKIVNDIIYNELVKEIINPDSRNEYIRIINKLSESGIKGIILGCTEIPLLISGDDVNVPVLNTTELHASYAVDYMLS